MLRDPFRLSGRAVHLSRAFGLTLAVALVVGHGARAATVTINPSADTTIYQGTDPGSGEVFEDNSCGAGPEMFFGVTADDFQRRALLLFDVAAAVPAGSTIDRVELSVTVNRSGDNQDAPAALHPSSRAWGEGVQDCSGIRGGGQGIDAATGDATWLDAEHQLVPWTSAGGDFGAASASTLVPSSNGGVGTWASDLGNPAMVADVQSWLDTPATNYGWIIVGDESRLSTTRRVWAREGNAPPTLTIDFTPTGVVYACCFPDGDCTVTTEADCTDAGGTPDMSTSSCSPNPCPQPVGACCNADESCSDGVARDACEAAGGVFQGAGSQCSDNQVDCGLTPFVDPLPLPAVLQPIGTRADGAPQYRVTATLSSQQLHAELPPTDVWTYEGTFPGPTIEATVGQPIEVTYVNDLPNNGNRGGHALEVDECAHGPNYWRDTARLVTHLHGGHVEARFDGQPELHVMPGESDVYEYSNDQLPATLWYHDHALGITRLNVYMGLAAFYILRDPPMTGENLLDLPTGAYEVPLVLQDREFNDDGSFFYPPTIQDAFFGDKVLVNGKVWPYFDVDQGKYRFRFLNGSQARTYRLRLENLADPSQVIPFELIGTDGGLIDAPIALDDFLMAPAERFDVVVDFAGFAAGTEIVLRNDAGGTPEVPNVMKFVVGSNPGHAAGLPATLRAVPPIDPTNVPTRHFELDKIPEPCAGQEWIIRSVDGPGGAELGKHWDDITERPVLGTTEIWEFKNRSNMMHPMHVHLVMFQVIERRNAMDQVRPLEPWEVNTWKDTVRVPPNGKVRIIMTFEDYAGRFPYHCHILDHEDHEMMRQFQATHDPAGCVVNGTCDPGEDCVSCPNDCFTTSGAFCGNDLCEVGDGENYDNCPADCAGKPNGRNAFKCGDPTDPDYVGCDDERCSSGDFYCRTMPRLVACCGDGLCEGQEQVSGPDYCAVDCDPTTPPPCSVTEDPEVTCDDGVDNDCDGDVDGADSDCATGGDCSQYQNRDDCRADPACEWQGNPNTGSCVDAGCTVTEDPEVTCDDGIDNDCDGLADAADPDCMPPTCDDDGVCEAGEDCTGCPGDCAGVTSGKPADRYCCGDGVTDPAEGDGTICDGNY